MAAGDVYGIPTVTSLPANPVDGQRVDFLADAAAGIVWPLKYRAGSANASKWEAVGAPTALVAEITTSETTASGAYAALATAGPSIVVPLAGDYDVNESAEMNNNASPQNDLMSYALGAAAAVDADAAWAVLTSPTFLHNQSATKTRRKTGVAAGTTIASRYRVSGGTAAFSGRQLRVTPVRVG